MAEFPALPLFTDAYLADTRHLTTLQHGAYMLLLITAWRTDNCSLPNDDVLLARWSGLDKRTWLRNKDTIMRFWKLNDMQEWCQGRLLDERKYVVQLRNINSAAGKASALKRLNRGSTTVPTEAQRKSNPHTPPTPIPLNTTTPTEYNAAQEREGFKNNFKGFKIQNVLKDHEIESIKKSINGWDFYYLAEIYNEGKNSGKYEIPKHPASAFTGWVKKYTKGKEP